ncbi:zinc finger protein ZFP2-like [Lampris incognitus]|uniref:zinc finger protein ZFP2-like n=1 Tax=Lampris incognitus TaxID=2546036 RepID=UPI0024B53DCF|nr:zinc finger protein ZFP2-like [Lampris incognitus]
MTNNVEDADILPNEFEDKSCFKKDCRVLLERLETRSSPSRPVRRNRGLKMKMILMQEKRGLRKKNPACKIASPLQAAALESSNITNTSPSSKSILPGIETKPASGSPLLVSNDEDSVSSYKDPSYIAPTEFSEDESFSNSSDEEPCEMGPSDNNDVSVSEMQCNSNVKLARKPHYVTQRGRCCICKEHVKGGIMDHMKVHFPDGEYTCPRCDTKFTILSSLKLHLRRTCYDQQQVDPGEAGEAKSLFKCNECEKAFRYKLSLDEHKRTHNELYCEVCRKVLQDSETLERHKASHTLFKCTLCEENFRLYKPLARHYENIHKLSRPYKCNHCPKSFSKLRFFIWHEWRHTGQLPFQCWHCSQRFKTDADLVSHLRVHTREKPFLCADCGKAFSSRSNLRRHLNFVHSQAQNERRFSCSQCEKSFKEKGALKKHEKTKHLHELFFHPCLYCGKLFSSSAMGRHKLIHTGEKPFKCKVPECDKYFRSTTEVKRHIMQHHSSERPFKCEVCEKGFVRACLLTTHMQVHSGEKPYVCSICGKAFPQLYSMKRHKKLVHTFVA